MNVKDLKTLIKNLPNETEVEAFNSDFEWYGRENMDLAAWKVIDGRLVYHTGNLDDWDDAVEEYRKTRSGRQHTYLLPGSGLDNR